MIMKLKPMENIWKMTENINYDLIWGPEWPWNWASEENNQHTSTSGFN